MGLGAKGGARCRDGWHALRDAGSGARGARQHLCIVPSVPIAAAGRGSVLCDDSESWSPQHAASLE